jgi:hypothetical protein
MSPPTPRALRPLPSSLSRAEVTFNNPRTQAIIEHQFHRSASCSRSDYSLFSRGAAPAPPSTGELRESGSRAGGGAAEDAAATAHWHHDMFHESRGQCAAAGAMRWGLHADDDEEQRNHDSEDAPALLMHPSVEQGGVAQTLRAVTPDSSTRRGESGSWSERGSCRAPGTASSTGSSRRYRWSLGSHEHNCE